MFSSSKKTLEDFLFLLPLAFFYFLYGLGRGSLASWDEGIYATVAKEIVQSGDWLRLTYQGGLWFDKPPLPIWATAFFYKWLGVDEFSTRLFSSLCGAGAVFTTYFIGTKLFNRWVGFLGASVLLSSTHFFRFARFGMMDAPLTFFLSLSLLFFWMGREKNRYFLFSGVALGLAFLCKGFAAFFVLPVVWIYCVWAGEFWILNRSTYWFGILVAAALALPWNLYELFNYRDQFMSGVVVKHLFLRTTQALEGHVGNYYFYIRTIINKYHPWILVGIVSAPYFLYRAIRRREAPFIFLSCWMFVIFGIITLVQTKLPWYVIPTYPALSVSVGYILAKLFTERYTAFVRIAFVVTYLLHVPYSRLYEHDYSRPLKGIAPVVTQKVPAGEPVYLYNYHESPAAGFYFDRRISYVDDPAALEKEAGAYERFYLLVRDDGYDAVKRLVGPLKLTEEGRFENIRFLMKKGRASSIMKA